MLPEHQYFNSTLQLKQAFDLDSGDERLKIYSDFTPFKDNQVGFSVQRKYPNNIRYIPPKSKNGKPDTVAIIHVKYYLNKVSNQTKVPLLISISPFDKYQSKHHILSFEDESCPTEESIIISKKTLKPIALDFNKDYYYDHEIDSLIDDKDNILTGEQILNKVFNRHLDTIHRFKGLRLRSLLRIQSVKLKVHFSIDKFATSSLEWMLKVFFGQKIRAIFSSCRKIGFELSYGNMVLWGGDCAGNAE